MVHDLKTKNRYRKFDRRLMLWQSLSIIFVIILIFYLFMIQVVDIRKYRAKAKRQRMATGQVLRGQIVDRNGIKLASDKTTYSIYAIARDFDHTASELASKLAPVLQVSHFDLKKKLEKKQPVILLKQNVDKSTAKKVKRLGLREISVDQINNRNYPQGQMAAHILGYYNADADLAAGVEFMAQDKLESVDKKVIYEKTPTGDIIYDILTDPLATTTPAIGETVTLTIDSAIQHICEKELYKMINEKSAQRGAAIVMNPKNGEILGYAVWPTYNPNFFKKANPKNLKNWTLTDIYPPGSTFKILTIASALELGVINENSKINDCGKIKIGNWEIKNYDYAIKPNPGLIDLVYYFEHSSNVGSVMISRMMNKNSYWSMLKKFGIGSKTGIDLLGESSGLLPKYTTWDEATHASMGYGYGASVTAIQMVSAVSAIANNGISVTPHVIKYSEEEAKTKIKQREILSPQTAQSVTRLLSKAVENSKSPVKLDQYYVAAKTGTSRKPLENQKGYSNALYTSVIGFLPIKDPELLIYVVVDSPKGAAIWGSTVAAPVFREIALQSARIMNIAPDKFEKKDNKQTN